MKYIIILLSCMAGFISSCQKADLQKYIGGDGIYFYNIDSANYSFANQVGNVNRDTIYIDMRILGDVKNYDRPVQLKAGEGTTASANKHYILPEATILANSNTLAYPVILLNSPELKTQIVTLILEAQEDANFPEGAGIINNGYQYSRFKVNFNDSLIKPTYWDNIQSYFGVYSNVKYKFMIDVAGFSDFSYDKNDNTELLNLKGIMIRELQEYVRQNGVLLDENNNTITFPN